MKLNFNWLRKLIEWIFIMIIYGIICVPLSFLTAYCLDNLFETEFLDNIQVLYITLWILIPFLKKYFKAI